MLTTAKSFPRDDLAASVLGYGRGEPSDLGHLASHEACKLYDYTNIPVWNEACQRMGESTAPGTFESGAVSDIFYNAFLRAAPPRCEAIESTKLGPVGISMWYGPIDDVVIARIDLPLPEKLLGDTNVLTHVLRGEVGFDSLPISALRTGMSIPESYQMVTLQLVHTSNLSRVLLTSERRPISINETLLCAINSAIHQVPISNAGHFSCNGELYIKPVQSKVQDFNKEPPPAEDCDLHLESFPSRDLKRLVLA